MNDALWKALQKLSKQIAIKKEKIERNNFLPHWMLTKEARSSGLFILNTRQVIKKNTRRISAKLLAAHLGKENLSYFSTMTRRFPKSRKIFKTFWYILRHIHRFRKHSYTNSHVYIFMIIKENVIQLNIFQKFVMSSMNWYRHIMVRHYPVRLYQPSLSQSKTCEIPCTSTSLICGQSMRHQ